MQYGSRLHQYVVLAKPTYFNNQPGLSPLSRPTYNQPMAPTQKPSTTPNQINLDTAKLTEISSESACQYLSWQIIIGIILFLLLAAAVIVPILVMNTTAESTTSSTSSTTTYVTTITSITATTATTSTTQTSTTSITTTTVTTATTTTANLPAQCSGYTPNTDATRSVSYAGGSTCDGTTFPSAVWIRFSGAAGTMLAGSAPATNLCNTQATGWYTGSYPAIGNTTTGIVCYNWSSSTCNWSNSIYVTNCNGYYIYQLVAPPVCNLRYCTT